MEGIKRFLTNEFAGLPGWVWLLIVGAGALAAFIIPKFFKGAGTSSQTASDSGTPAASTGLAIDPNTGLPYATEGMVPSGGLGGMDNTDAATDALLIQTLQSQQRQPSVPTNGPPAPKPAPKPVPTPAPKPAPKPTLKLPIKLPFSKTTARTREPLTEHSVTEDRAPARTYTVQRGDTLGTIAARELGSSTQAERLYRLNRNVIGNDWNLIRPGEQLRLA